MQLRGGGKIPRLSDLLAVWPTDRWLNVELKAGGRGSPARRCACSRVVRG